MNRKLSLSALLAFQLAAAAQVPPDHAERMSRGTELFRKEIRPVLMEQCLSCHGGEKTKGGFDISNREALIKGGDEGPAVIPFDAARSKLLKLLRHSEEPHMPEKKPRLVEPIIRSFEKWVEDGAPYDKPLLDGRSAVKDRSIVNERDRTWWSFKPLAQAAPPSSPSGHSFPNPIDRFILAKASEKKLSLSKKAAAAVRIRRAYLDLHGVPPAPRGLQKAEQDASADGWARTVDRLLDSPRYGERWARHWLDVARFAESSGFEHDYDREGAFHYRDFVIKALNSDLPFHQFVRWQLAGDEFEPDNPLALSATGFLGAGVFPTQITANEVERTRYDAMDDMLSTTGSAFLGLSIGCARCHDHKFDPIPSRDYYRMLSTFTTTVRSVIDLDVDPQKTRILLESWEREHRPIEAELTRYEKSLRTSFSSWLKKSAAAEASSMWVAFDPTNQTAKSGATFARQDDGSFLVSGKNADRDEFIFKGPAPIGRVTGVRLDALKDPSMKKGGPGRADNGNFALSRIRVFIVENASGTRTREIPISSVEATFEQNNSSLAAAASLDERPETGWAVDPQFGKDHTAVFQFTAPVEFPEGAVMEVRLEFSVNSRHSIGRPRMSVINGQAQPLQGAVLPGRIARILSRTGKVGPSEDLSGPDRSALFDWWKTRDEGWQSRAKAKAKNQEKKPDGRTKVLVCAEGYPPLRMHTQGADFLKETHILKRGSTDQKLAVADQGFLQVLLKDPKSESTWRTITPEGAKFSGRRRALASWLTDVESGAGSLTARVIVNRLWQHHFGTGLVSTPNDFGHTGSLPTHPELLDFLAGELIRSGWRLKPIHKLIMTSETYQQACIADPVKQSADPDNLTWTRRVPRRLEGESIRDSILCVSGALDEKMYGPGTLDERSRRRSIYFTVKRSRLVGSMVAFDQPEPLVSQGARPTTTVAPQALFVMNGSQVREWAEVFARNVDASCRDSRPECRVEAAYLRALSRKPVPGELEQAVDFLGKQAGHYEGAGREKAGFIALVDFCQVLFGLNEFAYQY